MDKTTNETQLCQELRGLLSQWEALNDPANLADFDQNKWSELKTRIYDVLRLLEGISQ